MDDFKIFAGNSNPVLAKAVCEYLNKPLGLSKVNRFSDGEIQLEIRENVRAKDVYIFQAGQKGRAQSSHYR